MQLFESEFSCDVTRGKVVPGGSQRATVTFSPTVVDTVSVEYLVLKCRGALNETILKLTGSCIGKGLIAEHTSEKYIILQCTIHVYLLQLL